MGAKLSKLGKELAESFEQDYGENGCCCHMGIPPCGYCTHPGNPLNLNDTPEAWEDEDSASVDIHDKEYLAEQFQKNKKMEIVFKKKNGEIRTMLCTRNGEVIPEDFRQNITESAEGKPDRPTPEHLFRVFDLGTNGWKSFIVANLLDINHAV